MQQTILAKLREAGARELPRRLVFCTPNPEVPAGGYILPVSRLDIVLSGRKRVTLPLTTGIAELVMEPGDSYFAPTGAWERHAWDTKSEMLCIVPRKDYLRVSYYGQRKVSHQPSAIYHHTGRRCSEPVAQVVQLLNRGDVANGDGDAALHLARALVGLCFHDCVLEPPRVGGKGAQRFEQVRYWLENHFQDNIGREQTAAQFEMTPAYLSRIFRQVTGKGFHDYLTRLRLDFARSLLTETELPVYLVSAQSGFCNPVHFVRRFRELEGLPPGQFRLRAREHGAPGSVG